MKLYDQPLIPVSEDEARLIPAITALADEQGPNLLLILAAFGAGPEFDLAERLEFLMTVAPPPDTVSADWLPTIDAPQWLKDGFVGYCLRWHNIPSDAQLSADRWASLWEAYTDIPF